MDISEKKGPAGQAQKRTEDYGKPDRSGKASDPHYDSGSPSGNCRVSLRDFSYNTCRADTYSGARPCSRHSGSNEPGLLRE